jgi:hypothetical protein
MTGMYGGNGNPTARMLGSYGSPMGGMFGGYGNPMARMLGGYGSPIGGGYGNPFGTSSTLARMGGLGGTSTGLGSLLNYARF